MCRSALGGTHPYTPVSGLDAPGVAVRGHDPLGGAESQLPLAACMTGAARCTDADWVGQTVDLEVGDSWCRSPAGVSLLQEGSVEFAKGGRSE
jgi:hypothetical protein